MKPIMYVVCLVSLSTFSFMVLAESSIDNESTPAIKKLEKLTDVLSRFQDTGVAISEGYVHYDGYDTFSMGEHWYNKEVYESGTCDGSKPSHLQYLVIEGKRTLIGTGYVCTPQNQGRENNRIFDDSITWHSHGPAWCLLPNGSAEDYRDLADSLPNKFTTLDWQSICKQEGGTPASQDIKMLHTWNWIPAPNGRFAHENFAIPFLRVGLPVPDKIFLESQVGKAVIRILKLAHGDTPWWYWRGFKVINASDSQRRKGWQILQQAKASGHTIQEEMIEIGNLQDKKIMTIIRSGEEILDNMDHQLAKVFTSDQMTFLNKYIASLQTHEHDH